VVVPWRSAERAYCEQCESRVVVFGSLTLPGYMPVTMSLVGRSSLVLPGSALRALKVTSPDGTFTSPVTWGRDQSCR